MKYLLDTNVISELRKRDRADTNVVRWVQRTTADSLCTSVLVMAELRRGIELKRRADAAQAELLDLWIATVHARLGSRIFGIDAEIANTWAKLSVPDMLPMIDGLLAATALVRGLVLVTRNAADVARTGVAILNPFEA